MRQCLQFSASLLALFHPNQQLIVTKEGVLGQVKGSVRECGGDQGPNIFLLRHFAKIHCYYVML